MFNKKNTNMKEQKLKEEIRQMLYDNIENRSTVILIQAKILDYGLSVYERAFKEATKLVDESLRK